MIDWSVDQVFGLCAAGLVGLGLYGVLVSPDALRRIVAFNVVGGGIFLFFGAIARRGAEAGFAGDPVPHALIITGIVVAFAATSLAVALLIRWTDLQAENRRSITAEDETQVTQETGQGGRDG